MSLVIRPRVTVHAPDSVRDPVNDHIRSRVVQDEVPAKEAVLDPAVALSLALQVVVVYTPFLQQAFGTVGLSVADWARCAAVASSVLWLREMSKLLVRLRLGR